MSSSLLAVGRGLDLELWLAGIFTAAELAAADLLLQLSGDDAAAATSTSTTTPSSSPRWVSPCREDLTLDDDEEPVVSTELDRRKRYRLLSDLYAATSPVPVTSAAAAAKKRRTDDEGGESESSSSSSEEAHR